MDPEVLKQIQDYYDQAEAQKELEEEDDEYYYDANVVIFDKLDPNEVWNCLCKDVNKNIQLILLIN